MATKKKLAQSQQDRIAQALIAEWKGPCNLTSKALGDMIGLASRSLDPPSEEEADGAYEQRLTRAAKALPGSSTALRGENDEDGAASGEPEMIKVEISTATRRRLVELLAAELQDFPPGDSPEPE